MELVSCFALRLPPSPRRVAPPEPLLLPVPVPVLCDPHVYTQPHTQLRCVTNLTQAVVHLSTMVGVVVTTYDSLELLQPPIINTVLPARWSTVAPTMITITGERCVCCAEHVQ